LSGTNNIYVNLQICWFCGKSNLELISKHSVVMWSLRLN